MGPNNANTPVMFFSRRIGLNAGRPVPIAGGGRLTGRAGAYSVGVLNIQSREDEGAAAKPTNFSVVRLKRDLLRRGNVGLLYTRRQETGSGAAEPGETFGVDGLFSLSPAFNINTYYARTRNHTIRGKDDSYLASLDYNGDRYGLQAQSLRVGTNFNPQVGFMRRTDFQRRFLQGRFSPRPGRDHWKGVRRFIYMGNVEYIENNAGRLDFREREGQFEIEMLNTNRVTVDYTNDYEFIPAAYDISPGVTVPAGGYSYQNLLASYSMGTQNPVSGNLSYQQGSLYDDMKRAVGFGGGRIELSSQFALEPQCFDQLGRPAVRQVHDRGHQRTAYTITPRMFVGALTCNVRRHVHHQRASADATRAARMFVVHGDGRDRRSAASPPS